MILDDYNLPDACTWLGQQDSALLGILQQYGVPPLWGRPANFASLVHIILEQQVSLESARAAFQKLQVFEPVLTPEAFLHISDEHLLQFGFSRQKKMYTRGVAEAILDGSLDLAGLQHLPDDAAKAALLRLKGIGSWTADIYLLFCLRRPDVLPKGDIALYEAIKTLKNMKTRPDFEMFQALTAHRRPWRSVGCRLLWHFYLCERGRTA
jgi:DNA-3-methyladenine glycosylase II